MWTVTNNTPFAAERGWARGRDGGEIWLVAVKATFKIGTSGLLEISNEQEPVCQAPKFRADPAVSSLIYDCDLPRLKVCTDILLHGHAYAPGGTYATEVGVGMQVADNRKILRVLGNRVFKESLTGEPRPSEPEPFTRMPITYEHSYGGIDEGAVPPIWSMNNPAGIGFSVRQEKLPGKRVPNIVYPGQPGWSNDLPPAGFGPIAGHWQPRAAFGGTYDEAWQRDRMPLLPDNFDDRYYQCAPVDQRSSSFLRGGENVELYNLTPDGRLTFRLPKVRLRFLTIFNGEHKPVAHEGMLHTVILEPDVPRLLLVFHTHLKCHKLVNKLLTTIVDFKDMVSGSPEAWEIARS